MSIPTSLPAFDAQDRNRWRARFRYIASYQIVNTVLLLMAGLACYGWFSEARALDRNSRALDTLRRHPPVILEGRLGLANLITYQDANTLPEDDEIRSALSFWCMYHFDHTHANVSEFRALSFAWMGRAYGDAIQEKDAREHYVKNILTGTEKQYKIADVEGRSGVENTVITRTEHKKDETESGAADVFAYRQYIGEDGLAEPVKQQDRFALHVTWQLADQVPDNLVKFNPRGIAVTSYTEYRSMQ